MVLSLHKQPFVTTHFQFITGHFVRHCALKNALNATTARSTCLTRRAWLHPSQSEFYFSVIMGKLRLCARCIAVSGQQNVNYKCKMCLTSASACCMVLHCSQAKLNKYCIVYYNISLTTILPDYLGDILNAFHMRSVVVGISNVSAKVSTNSTSPLFRATVLPLGRAKSAALLLQVTAAVMFMLVGEVRGLGLEGWVLGLGFEGSVLANITVIVL